MSDSEFVEFSDNAAFRLLVPPFRQAVRERASTVGALEVLKTATSPRTMGFAASGGSLSRDPSGTPARPPADPYEAIHAAKVADVSPTSQFESFAVVGEMLRLSRRPWDGPDVPGPAVDGSILHALGVSLELALQRGDRCASRRDVLLALVAETDALSRRLISADVLAEWMRITRDYAEVLHAPAIGDLENYGFVRLPRLLEILSWPTRRSADRALGVKGARAVTVMQFEAVRQAIRADSAAVGLDHVILALASVGHQVESRIAGRERDTIWKSATYLRSAGLAYVDVVRRLALKRTEDDSLTASGQRELNPGFSPEVSELLKELPALVAKGKGDAELVPALIAVAPERVAEVVVQLGGDPEPLLAHTSR
jgi:hypothetical protein